MSTFVRVVDGGSLSAAARQQKLSLPAVSRQLAALEAELGTALVLRTTRRLQVTDAGLRWYEHCVRVLREIEDGREAVRSTKGVRGTLVVSVSLTYGMGVIVPRLHALVDRHPQLVVELRLEDKLVDLVGEGVDVAVRTGPPPPDSTALIAHPLATMERVVAAAPKWLRKHGTPRAPRDLGRSPCLVQVTTSGSVVPWRLRRKDEESTVDVRGPLRSNAPAVLRHLALDGVGAAFLPDWLIGDDLAAGRLRRLLPEWSSPPIVAHAIHRAELRGSPRVSAFVEAMSRSK